MLRTILWLKYKIKDTEVFEKAYKYVEMYYHPGGNGPTIIPMHTSEDTSVGHKIIPYSKDNETVMLKVAEQEPPYN